MLANTAERYGDVAKIFHWLTALLILTSIPLGVVANQIAITPETLPLKAQLFTIHKTLGVVTFFVALARILWALSQPKPALLNADKKLESFAAETVHWVLYASLVIVPLSGWIHHAATEGFAPIWWPFGQSLPFIPKSEAVAEFFKECHLVFVKVLIASLILHIGGALKHHVIDKDATLRRMLFGQVSLPQLAHNAHSEAAPAAAAGVIYAAALGLASVLALSTPHDAAIASELAEAEADAPATVAAPAGDGQAWTVEEGTLGIEVVQFGSAVAGTFADWDAATTFDESPAPNHGAVSVTINIGSLTIGTVTNDALGAAFFNAEAFPTATYTGDIKAAEPGSETAYVVEGTLLLKGVEAAVPLMFDLAIDGDTATMTGATQIDRRTFNVGEGYNDESTVGFGVSVSVSLTATRAGAGG
ncbi:MAG: cytochrome b/b6 domain-containing protein [Pseudomonadota bacterium]